MKKQVTDLYATYVQDMGHRQDLDTALAQVRTHSPASHKGQHTVRHYFPWHFNNTLINTVTFHNSRPFVKICWLSPRIAHLILQNLLYIFFLIPEFLNGLTAPVPSQLWRLVVTHGTQKQNSLSTPASPGVWQRKCMSPVQCQCQRLWPGNIV